MSLTDFGPVAAIHYNPSFSESSDARGISTVQIGGDLPIAAAKTLKELCNNRDDRTTVGGRSGVLMWIASPYFALDGNVGYYIVESFDYTPYKYDNGTIGAGFQMSAAYLGDMA